MGVTTTQAETRLAMLLEREDLITQKWEAVTAVVNQRDDHEFTEVEQEHVVMYREQLAEIRAERDRLAEDVEGTREAIKRSADLRRVLAGEGGAVEEDEGGIVYRDFATYARDVILTRGSVECSKITQLAGGEDIALRAKERLGLLKQRVPANTLSSNVAGLTAIPQHIDQIFQVIDASRALVAAAPSTGLVRGSLTYPSVDTRPVVAVQASEKTEAGNTGMAVSMKTATASTYLGGGDLSWQALNWSTPDALALWFQLAAADYALKTETDAGDVVTDSAYGHIISAPLAGTPDFATIMTAVGAGYSKVYADSKRIADTIIMAPDRYGYLLGLTSTPQAIFANASTNGIGPLNILVCRGFSSGEIVVGDMEGLLVAETPGAPVELRVVEPAIGGVEVGIIGAFEAVVTDPGAFSLITTAS